MTSEATAPCLGSIQDNPAQPTGIIAHLKSIMADALSPAVVGTQLPISEAMYLAYSYSDEEPLTREQWGRENAWGRYFTAQDTSTR